MKQAFIGFIILFLLAAGCSRNDLTDYMPMLTPGQVETGPRPTLTPSPSPYAATEPEQKDADQIQTDPPFIEEPAEIDYFAVKPDESGNIMIIMYHGITDENTPSYDRSTEGFLQDLNTLYSQGYRLISMSDLINNRISVEAGCTPVVLTFDDGRSSAFSLVETEDGLRVKPGCAVDLLLKFCGDHPDFGLAASFYINYYSEPFQGGGTVAERLNFLTAIGFEIGNHTYSHIQLNELDAIGIQEEIGRMDAWIKELTGTAPVALSYPFGIRPVSDLREVALNGSHGGIDYSYPIGLREGQSIVTANPAHVQFDPLNAPRVRGTDSSTSDNEVQDLGYFLRFYERNPNRRYISDGNPLRVAVPAGSKNLIDPDKLQGAELFVY
ncbi:MAG: polysaccharide deacetylase family protein [Defluviitaleaceae bacterium]|nr:polysaccharide deacetylase family protein [Defluviitaleaceae bacterium]